MSVDKETHVIDKIFSVLSENHSFDVSLYSGASGRLLFFAEYYKVRPSEDSLFALRTCVRSLVDNIQDCNEITYSNGLSGVGAALLYVNRFCFRLPFDLDSLLEDIDKIAYRNLLLFCEDKNFDYMHGATGLGYYLHKRGKFDSLRHLLLSLQRNALEPNNEDKMYWKTDVYLKENSSVTGVNLSLSHGMASIALLLNSLSLCPDKFIANQASVMLRKTLNYFWSVEKYGELSRFPSYILGGSYGVKGRNSRLAWCYGDLGIGICLLRIGVMQKNDRVISKAVDILLSTTNRVKDEDTGIEDPFFCHGTSGLAQTYLRAFEMTGIKDFKSAQLYWTNRTMDFYTDDKEIFKQSNEFTLDQKLGLLNGIAGIGLHLLSHNYHETGTWDTLMLIV